MTYVDELLVALKTLFVQLFQPFLSTFVASLHASSTGKVLAADTATTWDFTKAFERWDKLFDDVLRGLENKAAQVRIHSSMAHIFHPVAAFNFTIRLQYFNKTYFERNASPV